MHNLNNNNKSAFKNTFLIGQACMINNPCWHKQTQQVFIKFDSCSVMSKSFKIIGFHQIQTLS